MGGSATCVADLLYLSLARFLFGKRAVLGCWVGSEPMPISLEPGHIPLDHIPVLLNWTSSTIYSLTLNF